MKTLSIVVARAGSKGLPNKHLLKIKKKAVFEYSIEYSMFLENVFLDNLTTVVSSDSIEIEKYCKERDINFLKRNTKLANDEANVEDVIYDVCQRRKDEYDFVSIIAGDTPIRYPEIFINAYNFLLVHKNYDGAISMQKTGKYNPAWMFKENQEILPKKKLIGHQRQKLTSYMEHDGHTLLFKSEYFMNYMKQNKEIKTMYEAFGKKIKPLLNDKIIIQIDTQSDFELAKGYLENETM